MKPVNVYWSGCEKIPIPLKSGKFRGKKEFLNGFFNSKERTFHAFMDFRQDPLDDDTYSIEWLMKFSEDFTRIEGGDMI